MEKICLFGGSFDPVHKGHLQIAAAAHESLSLDQVVFIPCQQSPHKSSKTQATGEERVDMLKMATKGFEWAQVDSLELEQEEPSFSWKTAETYRSQHPQSKLYWLIGTDQWQALDRWDKVDHFSSLVTFIVYTRGDDDITPHSSRHHHVIRGQHPASATQIRKQIQENQLTPWLNDDVSAYIRNKKLYL